jgi:glyoxylase-like metal-dependent hydrolase (beta-lactamase superfamily II)
MQGLRKRAVIDIVQYSRCLSKENIVNVKMIAVGPFQSNCFVVSCDKTSEAIIIDAGDDADQILSFVRSTDLQVKLILNTHAHIDHVSALGPVVSALSAPVLMHENEMPIYEHIAQHAVMFGLVEPETVRIDRFVAGGDEISFGRLTGKIIDTPGHSPGGISLVFNDAEPPRAFVGDVLFRGSIGRTDLPGSDHQLMMSTLKNIIMELPDDMVIHSGHGPKTTMAVEKLTNPFLIALRSS